MKVMGSKGRSLNGGRKKGFALALSALLLSACATTPASSSSTTVPVEATFGTLKLWSIVHSLDGLYSVVYLDPYWLVFNQQNPSANWKLKMPTNVSSRRGIVLATSNSGVKAVGFIPYGAQTNSIVFEYGSNGAYAPSFFTGSLLTSNQAMSYNVGNLFALATAGGKSVIEEQSTPGGTFSEVANFPFVARKGSIGFEGNSGVAVFSTDAGRVEESNTIDGGKSWSSPVVLAVSGNVQQIFIASMDLTSNFSTIAPVGPPNFAVVSSVANSSYTTSFFANSSKAASLTTTTPPILGATAIGSILEVDGAIGGALTLRTFAAGGISSPSTLQGIHGAVEAIYNDQTQTTVLASANGLPTTYSANNGVDTFSATAPFDVSALNG